MRHDYFEGDEARDELAGRNRMTLLIAVMAAGAIGVGMRYLLDAAITERFGDALPWSTLAINVLGSFALGLVIALLAGQPLGAVLRPALTVGLLGGFTTFSAFSIEVVTLTEDGLVGRAAIYVVSSVTLGIGAAFAGLVIGRAAT